MFSLFYQDEKLPILWELDSVRTTSEYSTEEKACQKNFSSHVRRDDNGRYIVKLPFNSKVEQLGEPRNIAL